MLYYQSQITAEYIHSVVCGTQDFDHVKSSVKQINPANNTERSALARQFLMDEMKGLLCGNVTIKKSATGFPVIVQDDIELDILASLSHDGNFAAYSLYIPTIMT